jgi:hypothetical protein
VNVLIVADAQFSDLARDLRRDARDLHADAPVSCPRRRNVIVPCHQGHGDGEARDRQGREPLEASEDPSKHKPSSTRRAAFLERCPLSCRSLRLGLHPGGRMNSGHIARIDAVGCRVAMSETRFGLTNHLLS